jgi:hypothetical protein
MNTRLQSGFRLAILTAGLCLAVFGIWRGELAEILRKAVTVCLECIGIG